MELFNLYLNNPQGWYGSLYFIKSIYQDCLQGKEKREREREKRKKEIGSASARTEVGKQSLYSTCIDMQHGQAPGPLGFQSCSFVLASAALLMTPAFLIKYLI